MTSVLNVNTIADKAGTGPVALTKQNGAKAFTFQVMMRLPSLLISTFLLA